MNDLIVEESLVNIIRQAGGQYGSRGYYFKVYSANLKISKRDGTSMPDAYRTNTKEDGSIEVDAICEFSAF